MDRFRVDGRVAVVTGAGRGIGAATAIALAEAGADVVISARTKEQLEDVARRVEAVGRRAVVVPADLSDLEAAAGLPEAAVSAFGRLDIVVNNVGGALPRPFLGTKPRHLEKAFQFNVAITHALTQAAVPHLLAAAEGRNSEHNGHGHAGPGHDDDPGNESRGERSRGEEGRGDGGAAGRSAAVVNISSVVGRVAGRGYLAYGTAKAALAHYTRLAASDLAPRIRVNAIAVGSVATSALEIVLTDDNLRGQMEKATPLGRIGDPEDVAAAVVFLASPASCYVTGKILEVDGGLERPNLDLGLPDL